MDPTSPPPASRLLIPMLLALALAAALATHTEAAAARPPGGGGGGGRPAHGRRTLTVCLWDIWGDRYRFASDRTHPATGRSHYEDGLMDAIPKHCDMLGITEFWDADGAEYFADQLRRYYPHSHVPVPQPGAPTTCNPDDMGPRFQRNMDLINRVAVCSATKMDPAKGTGYNGFVPCTPEVGELIRHDAECSRCFIAVAAGNPGADIMSLVQQRCVAQPATGDRYVYEGGTGLMLLSKVPFTEPDLDCSLSDDAWPLRRCILRTTVRGSHPLVPDLDVALVDAQFNYTFLYDELRDQPYMKEYAQAIVGKRPDVVLAVLNSGYNHFPEAFNLLLDAGYEAVHRDPFNAEKPYPDTTCPDRTFYQCDYPPPYAYPSASEDHILIDADAKGLSWDRAATRAATFNGAFTGRQYAGHIGLEATLTYGRRR